ncbi:MAG: PilZ domain-containing protein, partial [bacterium]
MENQNQLRPERRKSFRMCFRSRNQADVFLHFSQTKSLDARLLDLNAGGIRCCIPADAEVIPQLNQYIYRIVIQTRRTDSPLICSGIVRRVGRHHRHGDLSCAIEFSAVLSGNNRAFELEKDRLTTRKEFSASRFLERLKSAKSQAHARDETEKQRLREGSYQSFSDIASQLPADEQWWFYHVLDSLKCS